MRAEQTNVTRHQPRETEYVWQDLVQIEGKVSLVTCDVHLAFTAYAQDSLAVRLQLSRDPGIREELSHPAQIAKQGSVALLEDPPHFRMSLGISTTCACVCS